MVELLGTMLFVVILAMIVGVGWIIRYILVIHPIQEKDSIEMFSMMAVNEAALRYPGLGINYQAQKAEQKLRDILTEKGMMLVGDMTISVAVGSAMYKRKQEESKVGIEYIGIDKMETSVKLPAIRRKPKTAPRTPKINLEEFVL
ncbi:MAG: hypothetical protein AUF65_02415 [Chloroflexi bacterium 13_1_20CM_50_12]|nr:MAG: hypothetical protein AUF65_02415 [Chloroflexi bacterium 13_1_20CM_50_12]